jgi:hypothetical protein
MYRRLEKIPSIETGTRRTADASAQRRFDAPVSTRLALPEVRRLV